MQDYTGDEVTADNLYAVILGDKSSVKGGSGKVVDSKSNDRIFIYITDHGGPGVIGKFEYLKRLFTLSHFKCKILGD